jgi:Mg2+ and Co2+ transporter CorA
LADIQNRLGAIEQQLQVEDYWRALGPLAQRGAYTEPEQLQRQVQQLRDEVMQLRREMQQMRELIQQLLQRQRPEREPRPEAGRRPEPEPRERERRPEGEQIGVEGPRF